jgi:hypothetical protein
MSESAPMSESASTSAYAKIAAPPSTLRNWHLIIVALVASGLAYPLVKHFEKSFPMENLTVEMTNRIRANFDDPIAWAKERQNKWEGLSRNAMLNFGIFGCCLGTCLGLFSAIADRGTLVFILRSVLYGAGLGAVSGVAGGALAAWMALTLESSKQMDIMLRSTLIHSAGWVVPGLVCGLILSLTSRERRVALLMVGGVIGGLVAGGLYEPVAGILFQLDRTDIPMPEGTGNKYLFLAMGSVLMAIGARSATVLPSVRVASPRG